MDVSLDGAVFPVAVADVPRVIGGELYGNGLGLPETPPGPQPLRIPLDQVQIQREGDAWVSSVPFLNTVRDDLRDVGLFNAGLELVTAEYRPFVANGAWAVPEGGSDLDRIVEPGTFSNVDGGFGFVGAGYAAPVEWIPSTDVQTLAGSLVVNDPAAQVAINEVGDGYMELFNPTEEGIDLGGYLLADVSSGRPEQRVTIPASTEITAGGILVVDGPFVPTAGTTVQYLTGSGRLLNAMFVEADEPAWGAFPDGFSYQMPLNGPNLFHGPLRPSPGAPNRPKSVPAVINEVSTSGEGYGEVLTIPLETGVVTLGSSPETIGFFGVPVEGRRPFLTAPEGQHLPLDELGGSAFLLLDSRQVVDARCFGPQAPGRASGSPPDGPDGLWREDLQPTPQTPDAAPRLGG